MDKYKKMLSEIFEYTERGSISVSKKDKYKDGFSTSKITIKFNHINRGENDNIYEKVKTLIENILNDKKMGDM